MRAYRRHLEDVKVQARKVSREAWKCAFRVDVMLKGIQPVATTTF
jgi:hypothetical protein